MNAPSVIIVAAVTAVASGILGATLSARKMHSKVRYMLDALEDKETNFRFDEKIILAGRFNRTLNRLRRIFENETKEIKEQEEYFAQMLNHVNTGVIAVDSDTKKPKNNGKILYCNKAAENILAISSASHLRQLSLIDPTVSEAFENICPSGEKRVSFYDERGQKTIVLNASSASIDKREIKIITFNDITSEIMHSEENSWDKLIRVLTHEIMNTVTPIASLSEMLSKEIENGIDQEELKKGLETISESSKGLIKFVNTYRSLTRVSPPVKKVFYFNELAKRIISLTQEQAPDTTIDYIEKSDDIILYADENQIFQIIINLVKNAMQAKATKIEITAEIDEYERVVVNVSNNGKPISPESRKEIFVPFFTTKQDGSGIGLSLSRQIMRLHNGTMTLSRSDEKATVFTLRFG